MNVIKVCYRYGVRFDEEYYFTHHAPLAGAVLESLGLKKAEFAKIAGTADESPPPYQLVFTDTSNPPTRCGKR